MIKPANPSNAAQPPAARTGPGGWRPWDARAAALVFLATLVAYLPALRGGPIWDDNFHMTRRALRSLGGLARIWTDVGQTPQYYPVLHSAFWLEYRLWGGAVLGYHLVNVLLHAASACLFGLFLRRLGLGAHPSGGTSRPPGGADFIDAPVLGAFLFALHPVCVESVAWISEQKNTLSTFFCLLAALAFLGWREAPRARLYAAATLFFVLALLSKSVTATLPAALLVVLWWRRGRLSWREDVAPLAPWLGIGLAAGLFTAWVERTSIGATGSDFSLGAVGRFLVAGRVIWFYLGKLAWPANLTFIYPRWNVDAGAAWQYLFPLGVIALAVWLALAGRRTRGALAALLVFAGTLFPALGFLDVYPFRYSFVADHFQYLAALGAFAFAAGAWEWWNRRAGEDSRLPVAVAVPILCLLGVLTWRQCGMYRDAETLYRTTISRNPDCWMAYNNLAGLMLEQGRAADSLPYFEKVLEYRPGDAIPRNNLGLALAGSGRLPEAIEQFREAIRLQPGYAEAHDNLAISLRRGHRLEESIAECDEALRLAPGYPEARANRARALMQAGRLAEAVDDFRAALRIQPDNPEVSADLGTALAGAGRLPEAIAAYERALELRPDYAEAANNLGVALAQADRPRDALARFEQAVRIRPDYADARDNLAYVLRTLGRATEADAQAAEAARLHAQQGR